VLPGAVPWLLTVQKGWCHRPGNSWSLGIFLGSLPGKKRNTSKQFIVLPQGCNHIAMVGMVWRVSSEEKGGKKMSYLPCWVISDPESCYSELAHQGGLTEPVTLGQRLPWRKF